MMNNDLNTPEIFDEIYLETDDSFSEPPNTQEFNWELKYISVMNIKLSIALNSKKMMNGSLHY